MTEAKKLATKNHWTVKEDAGRGWRRVVASPKPIDIVEKTAIVELVKEGVIVIAAGGGGIPVYRTKVLKRLKGIDAVIDKDLAAERLAELVKADVFVSVTAVPNAYVNYGLITEQAIGEISASELNKLAEYGYFAPGSMLPKVRAAVGFAKKDRVSIITDVDNLELALQGKAGTIVKS
jgi:carbamate kinase